jgi:hypothetical protein
VRPHQVRRQQKSFEPQHAPNKSLDVSAKQRLSYHVAWLSRSCVDSAVAPHQLRRSTLSGANQAAFNLGDFEYVLETTKET